MQTLFGKPVIESTDGPKIKWIGELGTEFGQPTRIAVECTVAGKVTSIPDGYNLFVNGYRVTIGHCIEVGDAMYMEAESVKE